MPVYVKWPDRTRQAARTFVESFPGETLYAVKCNSDELVLNCLYDAGVRSFDVASLNEVRHIRNLFPDARLYFMGPVKKRSAIREAYFEHGVRAFVLDMEDELNKILESTDYAEDLHLFVRLALPKSDTATDFSSKFGAAPIVAIDLLKQVARYAYKLGLSFHVGTQCLEPEAYRKAIHLAADVIRSAGVKLDTLDIGGGFPSGMGEGKTPPVDAYMKTIRKALSDNDLSQVHLLSEPGRALVYSAGSTLVKVEARRGHILYLNDGTYGGLFESSASIGITYPAQAFRLNGTFGTKKSEFTLMGPTCDSIDCMAGKYSLPENIAEGDYIAFDMTGAYTEETRTPFNGFSEVREIIQPGIPLRKVERQTKKKLAAV
ncbi:MAG: type III PLP-dependent enzyme [Alphaproteobacteria bacterium]|nr:type III PLP-dependent enzyme [Alphaproteobacteria bacterium]